MVVVVFSIKLRPDLPISEYEETATQMAELAATMPGFIGMDYAATEGGELLVVRFDSHETLQAWHDHPDHVAVQQRGRERFFADYRIEICDEIRSYEFHAEKEVAGQ
jgi:heme-degrading monooxygenase HmoA